MPPDGCGLFGPVIQGLLGSGTHCKGRVLSISDFSIALCIVAWTGSDRDQIYRGRQRPRLPLGSRKRSHLGQMPYESEVDKLNLEVIWGPTSLQDSTVNGMSESQPQMGQSDAACELLPLSLTV
jgi:hypothetical protein